MARQIRSTARQHRALSILGVLAIGVGVTLGMVTTVGAEESTTEGTVAAEATTPEEPSTTQPPTTQPPTTQPPTTQSANSEAQTIGASSHTNPPQYEQCQPIDTPPPPIASWESDERADHPLSGDCIDGNPSQGGDAAVLALCQSTFGNTVTSFFDSQDDSTPDGNSDLTGVITAHTGGGTQVNITAQPGVTIIGVFVKAGNAYNAYDGNDSNMIGPLVGQDTANADPNFANISHWVACYSGTAQAETGSLNVVKSVQGTPPGGTTFTVNVDCETDDSHDGTLVFNSSGTLTTAGTIDALPITGIPAGSTCTITETADGGADSVVITPNNGVVTITANTQSEVTVTNTFIEVGGDITVRLDVDKQVVGSTNPANGTQFVVHVSCTGDATVEQDLTFTYPNGLGVQSITRQIPADGELICTVTETNPGGVILEGYKIDGGAIQSSAPTIVLNVDRPQAGVTVVNDPSNEVEVGGISAVRGVLPLTGSSTTEILLKTAAWLLVIGGLAWFVAKRRRKTGLIG